GDLQRPWNRDPIENGAGSGQDALGTGEQGVADIFVEARLDDEDPRPVKVLFCCRGGFLVSMHMSVPLKSTHSTFHLGRILTSDQCPSPFGDEGRSIKRAA